MRQLKDDMPNCIETYLIQQVLLKRMPSLTVIHKDLKILDLMLSISVIH